MKVFRIPPPKDFPFHQSKTLAIRDVLWYTLHMKISRFISCGYQSLYKKYPTLYERSAAFYNARPKAKRALQLTNIFLPLLFVIAYLGLWAYGIFEAKLTEKQLLELFFFPALCLLLVFALRLLLDRHRPYSPGCAGITPLVRVSGADNKSFPSRHMASAAVIAMAFMPYLPAVGVLLLIFSFALAYTRFAVGLHYPTDLLAGWLLGILTGALMFVL